VKKYKVEFSKSAEKQMESVPRSDAIKIMKRVEKLVSDPLPHGYEKLKGSNVECYRIRQGDYRIIYTLIDRTLTILIVKIGHRRDVYRDY